MTVNHTHKRAHSIECCHWPHVVDQAIITCFSHCLHRTNSSKSLSHHPANNLPDLADTGARVCACMCGQTDTVSHTHSSMRCLFITLSVFLPQAEILYAFKSGLSILCVRVCVYPSGNSCPDGISNFREACNQLILRCSSLKPGG